MKAFIVCLLIMVNLLAACAKEKKFDPATALFFLMQQRTFYMGMTPFPSAFSQASIEWNYDVIARETDLVAHHFDNGIPWAECLSGAALPTNVTDDWTFKKNHTPAGHKKYIAVTPIDGTRKLLALAWKAAGDNQALTSPWDLYNFNHADVKTAYLNYCRRIIQFFSPDYLNIAIEANLVKHNAGDWSAFLELHQYVYTALKAEFPNLPIMASLTGVDLVTGYTGADHAGQMAAMADIMPYSDYFGISLHPHMTAYVPNMDLPDDMFDRMFSLSAKPVCITETSFPAETLVLPSLSYTVYGTPEKQQRYFQALFGKAQQYRLRFVVNYLVRDYDQLCIDMGWTDGFLLLWRDTGLYDGSGNPRPARDAWIESLARPGGGY